MESFMRYLFNPWLAVGLVASARVIATFLMALLLFTGSGPSAHAANKATKKAEPRYKLVAGSGYTVCERYIKMLNALPAEAPPPVCEQKLHANFPDFAFPKWEELEVASHMELLREIERWLHSKNPAQWEDRRQAPTLDEWLVEVERRIRTGESAPRLRRTELVLTGNKRERLVAYTRDTRQCERQLARYGGTHLSWDYVFLYDEQGRIDPRKLDVLGGTQGGWHQVVLHNGKPYFVLTGAGSPNSPIEFQLQVAQRASESDERYHGTAYLLPQRCVVQFKRSEVK